MRKLVVALGVVWSCLFVSYPVLALNKAPIKELIVAADGEFKTIQSAINYAVSKGASASSPYIIRVMPGTYTETVTMMPYVDVVGSGKNNTKVSYSGSGSTLYMASNSTLKDIKVVHDTITGDIAIEVPYGQGGIIDGVATDGDKGVWVYDPGPAVKIWSSEIFGVSAGIGTGQVTGREVEIDSSIVGSNCMGIIANIPSLTIRDSVVIVEPDGQHAWYQGIAVGPAAVFTGINSKISAPDVFYTPPSPDNGVFKAAGSQLIGNLSAVVGRDKLVNCYDGNLNPISNQ